MDKNEYNDDVFINNLVDSYKSVPSESLKIQILKEFEPYFLKYAYMLCSTRTVDFKSRDTIKFLRLFMSDEERATEVSLMNASKRTVGYLRILFKDSTIQDLHDELVCIFLEQLARYHPMVTKNKHIKDRISFTHFVQVNIRYRLQAIAKARGKDALCRSNTVEYNDDINGIRIEPQIGVNLSEIDLRWTRGETSGDLFSQLEESERYLLYLKYDEKGKQKSDYSIARVTGLDRMYVRRKMLRIRDKLKQLVDTR